MPLNMNAHLSETKPSGVVAQESGNPYLTQPERGLELCARLVSIGGQKESVQEKLRALRALIEEEFLPLSERDANPTGAGAYRDLLNLTEDLRALVQFPAIEQHFTVAVGGMFSAGKSRFLNRILGFDLLPTDTTPTTSIPTYITAGEDNRIEALNRFHQTISIDADALQAICHAFHERFGVSFSHILRLIHVQRAGLAWPEITFLDTPGYSKSDSLDNSEAVDRRLAREHLRRADFLIWLVDIQNGTLPREDLLFLQSLDLSQPVLFVFNKADKKTKSEITQTLDTAEREIARARGVLAYGITAYSAKTGKEFGKKNLLEEFLRSLSVPKNGSPIRHQFERVFDDYRDFYQTELNRLRELHGILGEISLVLPKKKEKNLQSQALASDEGLRARIAQLKGNEKQLQAIREKVIALVTEIAGSCDLPLALTPAPRLESRSLDKSKGQPTYRFQASLPRTNQAQRIAVLREGKSRLRAEVVKIDSLGYYVRVKTKAEPEAGPNLEVLLTHAEVEKATGLSKEKARELLAVGEELTMRLLERGRCSLIYPPEKQTS